MDVAADLAAAAFTSAVDGLLGLSLPSLPGLALIELTGRVETQLRRMAFFDHSLVAALLESGACADVGATTTASLLVQALRGVTGGSVGAGPRGLRPRTTDGLHRRTHGAAVRARRGRPG